MILLAITVFYFVICSFDPSLSDAKATGYLIMSHISFVGLVIVHEFKKLPKIEELN